MCKNAQQRHDISHNNKCYETKLVNVFKPPTEVCLTHLPACQRRRGPAPAVVAHIAPVSLYGPAGLGSVCPSRQPARIKAERSAPPSAP